MSGTPVHFETTSSMSALPTVTLRRVRLDVELLAHELQVLARLHFLLAVELRLLEVLLRDRGFHLLDRDPDAAVDLAELLARVAGLAQLGARWKERKWRRLRSQGPILENRAAVAHGSRQ